MTFLEQLLVAINKESLEVVMVGNAAAALQGAPVTTLDVDFIIRDSETNLRKLKAISENLGASLNRPFEPASNMMRMMNHEIQADFLFRMDGINSFESIRSRASNIQVGSVTTNVASLEDIIRSKKAAGRDKDLASLPILEKTLKIKKNVTAHPSSSPLAW